MSVTTDLQFIRALSMINCTLYFVYHTSRYPPIDFQVKQCLRIYKSTQKEEIDTGNVRMLYFIRESQERTFIMQIS